jgi:FkbM family methyltransferase
MNYFFIRVLNKLGLLSKLNVLSPITLNNKRFIIPIISKVGMANITMSEPWMIKILEKILKNEKGLFIDVGVNVGQTLLKLKSVSEDIHYIGFEPNPTCVFYLKKLIKINQFKNTEIIPVGISAKNEIGVLNFYQSNETDSSASMIKEFRPEQKVLKREFIPLYNIDSIIKSIDIKNVAVLKIDVEGAELEVLEGFKIVLIEYKPIILMEILPVYNSKNIFRLERQIKIQSIFKELDYTIFRVKKDNNNLLGIERITDIGIHSDLNNCEYIIVPNTKINTIVSNFTEL